MRDPLARPSLRLPEMLRALADHHVEWVLSGSTVLAVYGAPLSPNDLDVVPALDPANLRRVAALLTSLDAVPAHIPDSKQGLSVAQCQQWRPDPPTADQFDHLFVTRLGKLDIPPRLTGTYDQLRSTATRMELAGVPVWVCEVRPRQDSRAVCLLDSLFEVIKRRWNRRRIGGMNIPSDSIPRHTDNGVGVESDGGFPGFHPSELDDDALLRVMVEAQQVVAAAQARQIKAMAELSRRRPRTIGHPFGEFVADEVAVELCLTRRAAESLVAQAVEMTTRTPAVLHAVETGALDLYRASAITDATYRLDDPTAAQVATDVVGRVAGRNFSEIRRIVRKAVLRLDQDGAERRRERARADRKVVLTPADDGMAELTAFLPADQATAVYRKVDALARGGRVPGDERGADARRADVFVNLLLGRRDPGVTGEPDSGLRPLVHVTVSAATLAGADDKPGTLDGYGPIGAAFARQIAADPTGTWKRLVTDPIDGSLLEHSRHTYRPPAALNDFVRARDRECRFPGCQRSARHCDLDHTIPWPKGPTAVGNLGALCRTHHRLKHETTWQLTQDNGRFCWTSPTGRHYITEPANYDPGEPSRPAHQVRNGPP